MNAAIAIVETIDRRVELIVAANRGKKELSLRQFPVSERVGNKVSLFVLRRKMGVSHGIVKIKSAGLADFLIHTLATGNNARDQFANAVIVFGKVKPIHFGA